MNSSASKHQYSRLGREFGVIEKPAKNPCTLFYTALCLGVGMTLQTGLAHAAESASHTETTTCRQLFSPDDPRIFNFVDTRESIDYHRYEGMLIGTIDFAVLPIFNERDPRENNPLYRLVNRLHIDTRPKTLANQLTIREGDALASNTLRENERLLRSSDYLLDAMIVPKQVCGERIDLLVVARDVWTLSPSASYSRAGGEDKSDIGLSETNLLGTGQALSLGRFSNDDRSGYVLNYQHEQLFGNHTALDLGYANNSDGDAKNISLIRPFYALDTSWSAGVSARQESRIEDIDTARATLNSFRSETESYTAFYGGSRGVVDGVARRWTVGLTDSRDDYFALPQSTQAPPENRRLRYPWLSYQSLEDRYWTTSNLSQIGRQEDVPIGTQWFTRLGYAAESWGSTENAWLFHVSNLYTASFGDHHLLQTGTGIKGRFNTGTAKSTFLGFVARYYVFIDPRNRWFTRLRIDHAKNINQDEQLTSGGSNNLRGYPNDIQRGNQRWLLTVERRHFTDWHLFQLIRVGGAVYLDMGKTRDTETPNAVDTDTLANVGFGLRLTSSKARIDKVLHLDIALPLSEREGIDSYQIIVSGKSSF